MRDLVLLGCIALLIFASFRRPYFAALGYIWVDFLQPQRLTYSFLNEASIAMFMALWAFGFYFFVDKRGQNRLGLVHGLIILFGLYATLNTFGWAVLYEHAYTKWSWVWKGLLFSVFLTMVLSTRRRIEAAMFIMILSMAAITISAGIKTLRGGGGYGGLSFLVNNNTGLYEGSTLTTVAMAFVPLVLWLYRHNGILPKSKLTLTVSAGIILSMILVTVGAETRTGLVAGGVLAGLIWLLSKRKMLILAGLIAIGVVSFPFLPETFKERMATIATFDEDTSASTRLGVWKWTIDYVAANPMGGGFGIYRINQVTYDLMEREGEAGNVAKSTRQVTEKARAFHNSFFEVLGELGYPGAILYLSIVGMALFSAWKLRQVTTGKPEDDLWFHDLGTMMTISMIVYFTGSMFVSVVFQPPYYYLLSVVVAAMHVANRERASNNVETRFIRPKRMVGRTSV